MPRLEPLAGAAGLNARNAHEELEPLTLPREHPAWVRDASAVSSRARELLARMRPIAVRVLTFWDHAVRSLRFGSRNLSVDGSGSYRLE